MSRSYRKTPVVKDGSQIHCKQEKQIANRMVRNAGYDDVPRLQRVVHGYDQQHRLRHAERPLRVGEVHRLHDAGPLHQEEC